MKAIPFAFLIFIATIQHLDARAQEPSKELPIASSSTKRQPHPWLVDIPADLARLVDVGKVQIEVDEAAVKAAHRTAITEFSFQISYRMRYQPVASRKSVGANASTMHTVRFYDVDWSVQHRIALSEDYRPTKPWASALLRHEFDHVAVSTDPRLIAIVESLDGSEVDVEVDNLGDRQQHKASVARAVDEYVKRFRVSIEMLVMEKYKALDATSSDGMVLIGDRKSFFRDLYSHETLRRDAFAYLEQALPGVDRVAESALKRHYGLP
jgi:hypothetical protein